MLTILISTSGTPKWCLCLGALMDSIMASLWGDLFKKKKGGGEWHGLHKVKIPQTLRAWVNTTANPLESLRPGAEAPLHISTFCTGWGREISFSSEHIHLEQLPLAQTPLVKGCCFAFSTGKCGCLSWICDAVSPCSRLCSSCALQSAPPVATDTSQLPALPETLPQVLFPKMKRAHHWRILVLVLIPLLFLYMDGFKKKKNRFLKVFLQNYEFCDGEISELVLQNTLILDPSTIPNLF